MRGKTLSALSSVWDIFYLERGAASRRGPRLWRPWNQLFGLALWHGPDSVLNGSFRRDICPIYICFFYKNTLQTWSPKRVRDATLCAHSTCPSDTDPREPVTERQGVWTWKPFVVVSWRVLDLPYLVWVFLPWLGDLWNYELAFPMQKRVHLDRYAQIRYT